MKIEERNPDRFDEDLLSEDWGTEPVESGFDRTSVTTKVEPGTTLGGRYQLGPVLGAGGAGRVFTAFDGVLNEHVALKVLREERAGDRGWIRRLAREVKIARLIRHPNVCRVFELGNEAGIWFITMELAEGGTLREVLRQRREASSTGTQGASPASSWEARLEEARAVCAGLVAIHAVGIVHRDVTPQNVLRMGDGRLVLSDFGLAIPTQESTTFLGGTPRYMAPEVMAGRRADQRSDVYQLGLVLHEILFGRPAEWQELAGHQVLKATIDSQLSTPAQEAVATLCADCLQNDPAARPTNAVAVAGRLAAAEQARPRGRWTRAWRRTARVARSRMTRGIAVAAVLLAVGAQTGRVALRPRPCGAGPARVAAVWDPARKEAVRRAFVASGRPSASTTLDVVTKLLDDHLRHWLTAYADACEATNVRGEQSAEVLDLRMACLNDDLDSFAALTRILADADATVVSHSPEASAHLEDLGRCANVQLLRSEPPLPTDPTTRSLVARQFERLNEANALYAAARYLASRTVVDEILQVAERTNHCHLTSRALALKGNDLIQMGALPDARDVLRKATFTAESCGDGTSFAMAASVLVALGSTSSAEAKTWFALGMAAAKRAGDDGRIESWLLNSLGIRRYDEGSPLGALRLFEQATTLMKRRSPDSIDTQFIVDNMALTMARLGRLDEALMTNEGALASLFRTLGESNLAYMDALATNGTILLGSRRLAAARTAFERVLRFAAIELPPDHWLNAEPLAGLGRISLAEGDVKGAIALLSRALSLTAVGSLQSPEFADIRFALARALELGRHDRARSRQLAAEALRDFGDSPELDRQSHEVRRWLEKHPPAATWKKHPATES